jgi:glycerol-3-phosphate acyltransferase PlsY
MTTGVWLIPVGYLLGSIPFGLLIGRAFRGLDVRTMGSGNIGATNVLRAAGKGPAALTLALDMLKGWVPAALALRFHEPEVLVATVALAAFLGHLYSIFLGFRGGKGVATFLGVLLALSVKAAVVVGGIWLLTAALSRYSSVAALAAAASSPPIFWSLDGRRPYVILTLICFGFIVVRHRDNLRRLLAGEEGMISQRRQEGHANHARSDRLSP